MRPFVLLLALSACTSSTDSGDTDWLCGHCDEVLIRRTGDMPNEWVVLRCPHCKRFSRFRQVQ